MTQKEQILEALDYYEAQGYDRLASGRSKKGISTAMVQEYLRSHHGAGGKNETIIAILSEIRDMAAGEDIRATVAPAQTPEQLDTLTAQVQSALVPTVKALVGLVQTARAEALSDIKGKMEFYSAQATGEEEDAREQLADALDRIADLEAQLAEAKDARAKAEGAAEAYRAMLPPIAAQAKPSAPKTPKPTAHQEEPAPSPSPKKAKAVEPKPSGPADGMAALAKTRERIKADRQAKAQATAKEPAQDEPQA